MKSFLAYEIQHRHLTAYTVQKPLHLLLRQASQEVQVVPIKPPLVNN